VPHQTTDGSLAWLGSICQVRLKVSGEPAESLAIPRPASTTRAQVVTVDGDRRSRRSDRLATEEPMEIRVEEPGAEQRSVAGHGEGGAVVAEVDNVAGHEPPLAAAREAADRRCAAADAVEKLEPKTSHG